MFDETGKAWLIEVNTLPSLESSSPLDYEVKSNITTDVLNLAGVELFDRSAEEFLSNGLALPADVRSAAAEEIVALNFPSTVCAQPPESCWEQRRTEAAAASSQLQLISTQLEDELRYAGGFRRLHPCMKNDDHEDLAAVFHQISATTAALNASRQGSSGG
jgi:hypothetical protein